MTRTTLKNVFYIYGAAGVVVLWRGSICGISAAGVRFRKSSVGALVRIEKDAKSQVTTPAALLEWLYSQVILFFKLRLTSASNQTLLFWAYQSDVLRLFQHTTVGTINANLQHRKTVLCRTFLLHLSFFIDRVKWRHICLVAIQSPFCRSRPSYCA